MAILVFTRLKDHPRETYVATSGALIVGRIDCICPDPARQEWSWGLNLDIGGLPFRRGGVAGDRAGAVAALDEAWGDWKTWAGLRDIDALPP